MREESRGVSPDGGRSPAKGGYERKIRNGRGKPGQPVKRFSGVNHTGWHKDCFVFPNETLPLNNSTNIIFVKRFYNKASCLYNNTVRGWLDTNILGRFRRRGVYGSEYI